MKSRSIIYIIFVVSMIIACKSSESDKILKFYMEKGLMWERNWAKEGGYTLGLTSLNEEKFKYIKWEDIYKINKVYYVKIDYPATDDIIEKISKLKEVKELFITSDNITDKSMEYISRMGTVEEIRLENKRITDAGLEHLKKLKRLKKLKLVLPQMTEEGLKIIGEIKTLESLIIAGYVIKGKLTDRSIEYISNLKGLKVFETESHEITDKGLEIIGRDLKDLVVLGLGYCEITDEGLVHLKGLANLKSLSLVGCKNITDAGLKYIAEIEGFRRAYWEPCKDGQQFIDCPQGEIDLRETAVTQEGAMWLKDELYKNRKGRGDIYVEYGAYPPPQCKRQIKYRKIYV